MSLWVCAGIVVIATARYRLQGSRCKKSAKKPAAKYAKELQEPMQHKPSGP